VQISAKELQRLAADVDDVHRDAMSTFREEVADLHHEAAIGSRRRFLRQAGVAGVGGALLTAGAPLGPLGRLFPAAAQAGGLTDTAIAGYAQGVELAAVAAYTAAAPALPDAVRPVGELFAGHHQEHADAFGAVAGDDAHPQPNRVLVEAVTPTLEAVAAGGVGLEDILRFARTLENQAAYTYAFALTALMDPAFAAATSTILPVETAHATVLSIAAGDTGFDALFPTGAFEVATVGDGTDPMAGFDPAVFGAG
jgi:rubrerythrin